MDLLDFSTKRKTRVGLLSAEIGLLNLLFWIGLFSLIILPLGGALVIVLGGCMAYLFCVGALTDIRMNETVSLVFVGPIVSIALFLFSAFLLLGTQTLVETAIYMVLGPMMYVASGLPILMILAALLGTTVRDRMSHTEVRAEFRKYLIKTRTFVLAGIATIVLALISQVNHQFFPGKDPGFGLGESILFLTIFLALFRIPLNEKLIISIGASIAAIVIGAMLGLPVASMMPMLVGAPVLVYLTAEAIELDKSTLRPLPIAAAIGIILLAFTVSYPIPYFLLSHRAVFYVILAIGAAATLIAIWQNLNLMEGIMVASVASIALMAELLIFPFRYEQLENDEYANVVVGSLFLPFFTLVVASVFLGKLLRENVLYIAHDGHRLANRGERVLDDWLTSHNLSHEAPAKIDDSLSLSFLVKQGNNEYCIQYWHDLQKAEDVAQHQEFQKELEERRLNVDFVFGLGSLDKRLAYILNGKTKVAETSKSSAKKSQKTQLPEEMSSQKNNGSFETFWKRKDSRTA
ncbi:MAG: hypothetical protein ACE5OZ_01900 [Candidatus Heimdallarchaeota archaeon]